MSIKENHLNVNQTENYQFQQVYTKYDSLKNSLNNKDLKIKIKNLLKNQLQQVSIR